MKFGWPGLSLRSPGEISPSLSSRGFARAQPRPPVRMGSNENLAADGGQRNEMDYSGGRRRGHGASPGVRLIGRASETRREGGGGREGIAFRRSLPAGRAGVSVHVALVSGVS